CSRRPGRPGGARRGGEVLRGGVQVGPDAGDGAGPRPHGRGGGGPAGLRRLRHAVGGRRVCGALTRGAVVPVGSPLPPRVVGRPHSRREWTTLTRPASPSGRRLRRAGGRPAPG